MVAHNTLTDPELHEPKGVSTAASGSVYVSNGSGSGSWTSLNNYSPNHGTHQDTTSGTSVTLSKPTSFTKNPQRITIVFNGVSTNGSNELLVRAGSTTPETSGYQSSSTGFYFGSTVRFDRSAVNGFVANPMSPSIAFNGTLTLTRLRTDSNVWISTLVSNAYDGSIFFSGWGTGTKTFSGEIDKIAVTTTTGIDIFDAGTVNVIWE